ncbi:MAG: tetratricopeptide repeat protein [Bacteroidetes bacterium]|nr:tetratricopeptide repeat protein [Bacteroidota bacterium]
MANRVRNNPAEPRITSTETNPLDNVQVVYEKNKKAINTTVTVVLLVVVAFFAYTKLYKAPREDKAATAISYPQRYFQADSMRLALQGDGQHLGFLKIEKKYDGTKAANLAHYYAGICYLHMGDFNNAIKQLKDFDGKGTMVQYAAWGALGDAYMEDNKVKDGIDAYEKAAGNKEDEILTPLYLLREGIAYEMNNQPENAKKAYIRIRDEYPQSLQARDMDKYLARLGVID